MCRLCIRVVPLVLAPVPTFGIQGVVQEMVRDGGGVVERSWAGGKTAVPLFGAFHLD